MNNHRLRLRFRAFVLAAAVLLPFASATARAAEPKVELLWPQGAPGAQGDRDADKPSITVYLPDPAKASGATAVICPGGGYAHLAMDHEGSQVAEWLNSLGIAGFVLKYRLGSDGYRHPAPLQDAQRAMRMVRARAKEWNIDPKKVGVVGFSAGGHLASTLATHYDKGSPDSGDIVSNQGCRPDFAVLAYPVISLTADYMHKGSLANLLGKNPDKELAANLSNDTQVTKDTPPTFMFQTDEDHSVPAENVVSFYLALRKAKVPAELHIYEKGKHGIGLAQKPETKDLAGWPDLCAKWLRRRGLVKE